MPISKRVEREVLINSHQYMEGMADRITTLQASLAEIESRLKSGVDKQTRKNLEAQRSTIIVPEVDTIFNSLDDLLTELNEIVHVLLEGLNNED